MYYIPESLSSALISHKLAYQAVRQAFIETKQGGISFAVVNAHSHQQQNRFSIKSAASRDLTGLKVGSYWPENISRGIACHSSTIFLLDEHSGKIDTIIEGSLVNAYRTAAADAVAVDMLAREDATALAIFGTGHQAAYECKAIAEVRNITQVYVIGRSLTKAQSFCLDLQAAGINAQVCDARTACQNADIIVTATSAKTPLFKAQWVTAGTHIASMGSDAPGKQELPPALFSKAELFCDLAAQSMRIGEFQHAYSLINDQHKPLTMLADVLLEKHPGRTCDQQITLFDSSGIALQDLVIANLLKQQAKACGKIIEL